MCSPTTARRRRATTPEAHTDPPRRAASRPLPPALPRPGAPRSLATPERNPRCRPAPHPVDRSGPRGPGANASRPAEVGPDRTRARQLSLRQQLPDRLARDTEAEAPRGRGPKENKKMWGTSPTFAGGVRRLQCPQANRLLRRVKPTAASRATQGRRWRRPGDRSRRRGARRRDRCRSACTRRSARCTGRPPLGPGLRADRAGRPSAERPSGRRSVWRTRRARLHSSDRRSPARGGREGHPRERHVPPGHRSRPAGCHRRSPASRRGPSPPPPRGAPERPGYSRRR